MVNNYRPGGQYLFNTVAGANGDVILHWQDNARGGYYFIQRFDGSGARLQSDEWYVRQNVSAVALDRSGNFAVASPVNDGNGWSIHVTVYRRDGSVKVPAFKVNATAIPALVGVWMASNAAGQLVVSWSAYLGPTNVVPYARTFSPQGVATSPEVMVGTVAFSLAQGVAIDAAGNFAVVFTTRVTNPAVDTDVVFRRYTNAGRDMAGPVRANTYNSGQQNNTLVAMAPGGASVAIWESGGQDGSGSGLYGQRFDAFGWKVGSEFRINESTYGGQVGANVGMAEDGSFIVSWSGDRGTAEAPVRPAVFMRQYQPDGTPVRGEQLVYAPAGTENVGFTWLGVDPAGVATIGWRLGYSSQDADVFATRYLMDNQPATTTLSSGLGVGNLSGAAGSWQYFKITVPAGRPSLTISLSGPGTGDANLYGRLGNVPSLSNAEVVSTVAGNAESIVISNVPPGTWYFGVQGASAYSGVTLTATY